MTKTATPATQKNTEDGWISRPDAIKLLGNPNPKTFDRWRKLPEFPKARKASPTSRLVFFLKREILAWMARRP